MRISQVTIRNFRSFKDQTISFDEHASLVGANGAGKSAVLTALNVFFAEPNDSVTNILTLERDDFHNGIVENKIEIVVTFISLSDTEQKDLSDYYRHGKLIVSAIAVFDPKIQIAPVKQYGSRLAMREFAKFFAMEKEKAKAPDLVEEYKRLRDTIKDLPNATSKAAMAEALQNYESANLNKCEEIQSHDEFYGINQSGKLNKYIQWVYIPAVKNAADEQRETKNGALGKLLARTVRSKIKFDEQIQEIQVEAKAAYEKVLSDNQAVLNEVSNNLKKRLTEWSHSGVNLRIEWAGDPLKAIQVTSPFAQLKIGEGSYEGQLNRLGHGLQRSYIIALLQELAAMPVAESMPKLILGCEEPELYQHPPQSRHLSAVLKKIAHEGSQVIVTTHSPIFVNGETFKDVRVCRQENNETAVTSLPMDAYLTELKKHGLAPTAINGTRAKLYQILQPQLSEMFFARKVIFVEGLEDQAYLLSAIQLYGHMDIFRKGGAHIVPTNGKSELRHPLIISKLMNISSMVIFDSDSDVEDKNGKKEKHRADNETIIKIFDLEKSASSFPEVNFFSSKLILWKTNIGDAFREDCGEHFTSIKADVEKELGQPGDLGKNILAIAELMHKAIERKIALTNMNMMVEKVKEFILN